MSDLGLDIAASGLIAQQALLDTAAQNLSNVSTPGYAVQTANLTTEPTESSLGVGQGVLVTSVTSATSALYESLATIASGQLGAANAAQSVQSAAQEAFPEPSTTGLSSQIDNLFSALSTLATQPSDSAADASVVQAAQQVATTLNSTYSQLDTTMQQLTTSLQGPSGTGSTEGLVGQANQLINQIAQLNQGIVAGVGTGQNPNGLIDQRSQAVSQLAGLLGITTTAQSDGSLTVSVNGAQLVNGSAATDIETATSQTLGPTGVCIVQVQTVPPSSQDQPIVIQPGGQIGATLTGVNTTIPTYESQLSAVADALADPLNYYQSNGVSAAGTPGTGVVGATWTPPPGWSTSTPATTGPLPANLFVNDGSATTYTDGLSDGASTITVNPTIAADPTQLATASASSYDAVTQTSNNDPSNVQLMASVPTSQSAAFLAAYTAGTGNSYQTPGSLYNQLVGLVGTQTQDANTSQSSAQAFSDSAQANVSSVEGVDSNAETVNVLAAQQAFQAISSVVSSINTSYQSLLSAV